MTPIEIELIKNLKLANAQDRLALNKLVYEWEYFRDWVDGELCDVDDDCNDYIEVCPTYYDGCNCQDVRDNFDL